MLYLFQYIYYIYVAQCMKLSKTSVFILAAGLGTRLYPLTLETPKPLIHITETDTILDYILAYLGAQEVPATNTWINVHYLPLLVLAHLAGYPFRISSEPTLLETAGALKKREEYLTDPFIVLNGDTIVEGLSLQEMLDHHKKTKSVATLFTKHNSVIHTGGVYVFNKEVLTLVPSDTVWSIKDNLMPALIRAGAKVSFFNPDGSAYIDCGTPEGLAKARALYGEPTNKMH